MRYLRRFTATAWAILAAVVALFGSLVSIVLELNPGIKPDPREKIAAAVRVFAVEPDVALDDWSLRTRQRVTSDPVLLRALHGEVIYVRTELSGFKRREATIRTTVYDARTRRRTRLTDEKLSCLLNHDLGGVGSPAFMRDIASVQRTLRRTRLRHIESPSRTSVQLLFLPPLRYLEQRVFVRVEVMDDAGILAVTDSPVLTRASGARGALRGSGIRPGPLC